MNNSSSERSVKQSMSGVQQRAGSHRRISLRLRHIAAIAATSIAFAAGSAGAADTVRPEIGKPLQSAQEQIKKGRYSDALKQVEAADRVGSQTSYENYLIERMRLAAASGAGDLNSAAKAYDVIDKSGRVGAAEKLRMMESMTGMAYRAKDYGKTMQWGQRYLNEGGNNSSIRTLLIQAQYLSGDFAGAAKELTAEVRAVEKAGRAPAEDRLNLLFNAAQRLNDADLSVYVIERLITYYPKKAYWADLLGRLQRKQSFSDRFALDVFRLSLATGVMESATDYMEMAQLAVQAGFPAEGKTVLDKGYAAGVLGVGEQASRHQRLRDLVAKRLADNQAQMAAAEKEAKDAKDGNGLVDVGYNLVVSGQGAKGLDLMQQGIKKGGLKRPEDAELHLGIAQTVAGQSGKALTTFRGVKGKDGSADLARLWALQARKK